MKGGLGTMEAQMNIRRNAMEMQEYLSDLKVWEDSVKKKDKDLKKGRMPGSGSGGSGGGGTPAPRGKAAGSKIAAPPEHMQAPASQMHPDPRMRTSSTPSSSSAAATTAKKKKKKKTQQQGSDSAASHTYDNYRSKWEKFDVDAALAEADGEDDDDEEESEEEEEEEAPQEAMPPIRKPLDADGWRSKGNEWFKMGDFRQAKDCYSSSIGAAPNSLAYANRAMACLKLGEHRTAEEDCTAAIGLDPLYLKSWQRRGAARKEQGRLQEAAADFEMALRLQPSSTALRAEFQACFDALQSERKLLPLRRRTEVPVRVSKEDKKQQKQQGPASSSAAAASASAAQEANGRGSGGAGGATEAPSAAASSVRDRVAAAATGAAERVAKAAADHAPPKNSTEFETAWKSLRGDTAAQASYLRRIDPSALPVLFKTSLTGPLLNGIAAAALSDMQKSNSDDSSPDSGSSSGPDWAMDLLEGLTKVPRFDMTAMLLPRADKAALKSSIEACLASAASSPGLCGRLEAAKKKLKV